LPGGREGPAVAPAGGELRRLGAEPGRPGMRLRGARGVQGGVAAAERSEATGCESPLGRRTLRRSGGRLEKKGGPTSQKDILLASVHWQCPEDWGRRSSAPKLGGRNCRNSRAVLPRKEHGSVLYLVFAAPAAGSRTLPASHGGAHIAASSPRHRSGRRVSGPTRPSGRRVRTREVSDR